MSGAAAPALPHISTHSQLAQARSALSSTCQAAVARLLRSLCAFLRPSDVSVGVDATHKLRAMVRAVAKTLPRPHPHLRVEGFRGSVTNNASS